MVSTLLVGPCEGVYDDMRCHTIQRRTSRQARPRRTIKKNDARLQDEQCNRRSHFTRAVHSHNPRQRRNGPFCCCMTLFAANALQCIVSGEENPQNCPLHWDFVTLLEEDRATAIGNMHKNLVIARVVPEIPCWIDRHTHRQADRRY